MNTVASLMFIIAFASASAEDNYLVRQNGVQVEFADIDAIVNNIPEHHRARTMDDPKRIEQYLSTVVLHRALADKARTQGLDQDPLVQREIQLAVERVLANRQINRVVQNTPSPNYEQLAKERYLTSKKQFQTQPRADASHILVKLEQRTEEEALARAYDLLQQARDGSDFQQLAVEHSEDPGVRTNLGKYSDIRLGQLVPEFEKAVFSATEQEQLLEPVKTVYGYHVILVHEVRKPRQRSFEEVKQEIIAKLRADQDKQVRDDYVARVSTQPMEVNQDAILSLRNRYAQSAETSESGASGD